MRPHISYNQVVNHVECGWYHKLDKVNKLVPFNGNIYSAFGRGIHAVPEYAYDDEPEEPLKEELECVFEIAFLEELKELEDNGYFKTEEWEKFLVDSAKYQKKESVTKEEVIEGFMVAGKHIAGWLIPELNKQFGNFKVLGIEEKLRLPIPDHEDYDYLGFVDFIIQTEDEKIWILDWKSCSWGWGTKYDNVKRRPGKKSDKMVQYQLTYYKHFYMKKYGITDYKAIETAFVLLKRSPGTDKEGNLKNPVEFFRVTSGKKKIENALNLLKSVAYNVANKRYMKNRKNCKAFKGYSPCVFRFTEHCK